MGFGCSACTNWTPSRGGLLDEYCEKELDPLLNAGYVDPAHPFPRVINKALCLDCCCDGGGARR